MELSNFLVHVPNPPSFSLRLSPGHHTLTSFRIPPGVISVDLESFLSLFLFPISRVPLSPPPRPFSFANISTRSFQVISDFPDHFFVHPAIPPRPPLLFRIYLLHREIFATIFISFHYSIFIPLQLSCYIFIIFICTMWRWKVLTFVIWDLCFNIEAF